MLRKAFLKPSRFDTRSKVSRYAGTVLLVAAAILLNTPLTHLNHERSPLFLFLFAIVGSAYWGGLGPGLLATLLSALYSSFFDLPPRAHFSVAEPGDVSMFVLFCAGGALVSYLIAGLHATRSAALATLAETDRQQRQIYDMEERYKLIIGEVVEYAMFTFDRSGTITSWNPGVQRIFGYKQDEFIGKPSELIFTPEDRRLGMHAREMEDAKRYGRSADDRWHLKKDGTRVFVNGVMTAHFDTKGELTGFSKIVRDNTERKRMDDALKENQARMRLLLDNIPLLVSYVTPDLRYRIVNAEYRKWYGQPGENAVGQTVRELLGEKTFKERQPYLERALTGEKVVFKSVSPSVGGDRDVEVTYLPEIRDDQVEGVFVFVQDISERQHAERRREEIYINEKVAREQAEITNKTKDQFLAVVSHELRTPLNAIMGWAQLLLRLAKDNAQISQGLDVIKRNAEVQAQLISDLLDVSRIVSGKLSLEVAPVDLRSVIDSAISSVSVAASQKGVELDNELPSVRCMVQGDGMRLQQVIWNLLSNAVKFTPTGGRVQIRVRHEEWRAEIAVMDTGPGISADVLPHIFERFTQGPEGIAQRNAGLGLGLNIARNLVEMHGGRIRAENRPDTHGAIFTVTLPAMAVAPDEHIEAALIPAIEGADTVECPRDLSGINVLVVEQDPDSRDLMARTLRGCNAMVTETGSRDHALKIIEHLRPDVLISDTGPDGTDAASFMHHLRSLPADRGGKIHAIAISDLADGAKALAPEFEAHLTKPVTADQLIAAVDQIERRINKNEL